MKSSIIMEGKTEKIFILLNAGNEYAVTKLVLTDEEIRNNALNDYEIYADDEYRMRKSYGTPSNRYITDLEVGDEVEIDDKLYLLRIA